MGWDRLNDTADPLNVVHIVKESVPSCSLVAQPLHDAFASTGIVTGIGTEQLLLSAPTLTPVMDVASSERV